MLAVLQVPFDIAGGEWRARFGRLNDPGHTGDMIGRQAIAVDEVEAKEIFVVAMACDRAFQRRVIRGGERAQALYHAEVAQSAKRLLRASAGPRPGIGARGSRR